MSPTSDEPTVPTASSGPLAGIKVLDLSRLAPGPYASMLLAAMGAEVIFVAGGPGGAPVPDLHRGKRMITLNLKSEAGIHALHRMVRDVDVVIEGFRPGVATRLGAGYEDLLAINPRLVYCSLTGYGQAGPMSDVPGHDINYLAVAGLLGALGPSDGPPAIPLNLLADFAGGGLFAAFGILGGIIGRERSGVGTYIDAAMVDGVMSLMSMWYPAWMSGVLRDRGDGLTTGAAPFYRAYACADGRHVAIGSYEPQFFAALWDGLDFTGEPPDHFDRGNWPELTERLATAFRERTRDQWASHFAESDACVTPVLAPDEVWSHPQNQFRHPDTDVRGAPLVPIFDGEAQTPAACAELVDETSAILSELGFDEQQIREVAEANESVATSHVPWPPF